MDCVTRLSQHYGYNVITLAPFQEPQRNDASWQALAAVSYIGIECYLSGTEVWNSGSNHAERRAWAQGEYQDSKNAYMARGVPAEKLFVTEHFANNGTHQENGNPINWGRAGLASAADWDHVIMIRQDAILNVGFDGFLAYNWGGNGMGVSEAEQIQHEYYYRSRRVLSSQQPQWLSDSAINVGGTIIPLSWTQPLNWLGGVPNGAGAEANFWRTLSADRTITLDGSKTIGTLTFDSPFSYSISTGTGGTLVFYNSGSVSTLVANQGSHTIGATVQINGDLNAEINAGTFTFAGSVTGTGEMTKSGAGTLAFNGFTYYAGDTTVEAGKLTLSNRLLANTADVFLSAGATLDLQFSGSGDVIRSLYIDGALQPAGTWGAPGSGAEYTSPLITGTGWLQPTVGPLLIGDYNSDGVVDAADYVVWRKGQGGATLANRDPNNTGAVGQDDYNSWRSRFGQSGGAGGNMPDSTAVPEPFTWSIALAGVLGMFALRCTIHRAAVLLAFVLAVHLAGAGTQSAFAEPGKGHRILIERGLQVQGMVTKDDVFHLSTYQDAHYSAIHWLWESNPSQHGAAPGYPWARWVGDENQMPGAAEQPYLSQLVALQLGDEWHLNDPAIRDRAVNWFNAIRNQWPDTILYMNNYGGQVTDAALADFVTRAQPDMLAFDTYPWRSVWAGPGQAGAPIGGPPTTWYGELRRYRVHAQNSGLPLAIYRQTFHSIQDYDQTVYRDPSPSELSLNTFGALAFGTTTFIDFTYNTGASSLFTTPGGDSNPTTLYAQQADINRRARNLGKTLVHLIGLHHPHDGGQPTTDIMILRGRTGPSALNVTPVPTGFAADPQDFSYTWWEFGRNDPYLAGWSRTNLGTANEGRVGDVILSWFKPLDPSLDDPSDPIDQLYLMVVNGLTSITGTAADCRQKITLDFFKTAVGGAPLPGIVQLNPDTGLLESLPLTSVSNKWRIELVLDGGQGTLLKFDTGDPFLGITAALSGDFNSDGSIDAADYIVWRKDLGTMYTQDHYNEWRANFGETAGAGSSSNAAVPEPASAWLIVLLVLVVACLRSRLPIRSG